MPHAKLAKTAKEKKTPARHSMVLSVLMVEDKVIVDLKSVEQTVRVQRQTGPDSIGVEGREEFCLTLSPYTPSADFSGIPAQIPDERSREHAFVDFEVRFALELKPSEEFREAGRRTHPLYLE